jgi:hypothetical protein
MDIATCQSIVQTFFQQHLPSAEHMSEKELKVDGTNGHIIPDDTYEVSDCIIAIEYENTKRPVESITKYWWLLTCTNWLTHAKMLKVVLLPLRPDFVRSRIEVIPILGNQLAAMYPQYFQFYYLSPERMQSDNIEQLLLTTLPAARS